MSADSRIAGRQSNRLRAMIPGVNKFRDSGWRTRRLFDKTDRLGYFGLLGGPPAIRTVGLEERGDLFWINGDLRPIAFLPTPERRDISDVSDSIAQPGGPASYGRGHSGTENAAIKGILVSGNVPPMS